MAAYKLAEVALARRNGRYVISVGGEPLAGESYENPLEAWVRFLDIADCRVRRRIGDLLESQGRNRYTGEIDRKD